MTSPCPHAHDDQAGRTCGLVASLSGLPPDQCGVGLDACRACEAQPVPQTRNHVTVSLAVSRVRPHDLGRAREIWRAWARRDDEQPASPTPSDGPGTRLRVMLKRLQINHEPGCPCREYEQEMNASGPDWCEENIGLIVSRMKQEAARRNLPFSRLAASLLVKLAIRQARWLARRDGT